MKSGLVPRAPGIWPEDFQPWQEEMRALSNVSDNLVIYMQ